MALWTELLLTLTSYANTDNSTVISDESSLQTQLQKSGNCELTNLMFPSVLKRRGNIKRHVK